jgi:hypothetical protein
MEQNIQRKMHRTGYSCDMSNIAVGLSQELSGESAAKILDENASSKFPSLPDPAGHGDNNCHHVRTISSVDGKLFISFPFA